MKKQNIILLALLAIVGIVYFTLSGDDSDVNRIERRDFTIKEPEKLDKIVITSKVPSQVVLEKQSDFWMVNNEYKASKYSIDILLNTLKRMEIKHPTGKQILNKVYNELSTKGIKVELYAKNNEVKTFYVGGNTFDERGTYMMIKDALSPYAIHIPGFEGYLRSRFIYDPMLWREQEVMDFKADEIEWVSMKYHGKEKFDFKLSRKGEGYELENFLGDVEPVNATKAAKYFNVFQDIQHEGFVNNDDPIGSAQILTMPKVFNLTIKPKGKDPVTIRSFQKDDIIKSEDGKSYLSKLDEDRLYATDGKTFYSIQYLIFNPLIKQISDFK